MRKLIIFLSMILLAQSLTAQKILAEFTARYQLTYLNNNKVQLQSNWDVYVKGALSRVDLRSKAGTEITVIDGKNGTGKLFKEYSGQKLLIQLKKENWKFMNDQLNNLSFEVVATGIDYKGYSCNKAIATTDKQQMIEVLFLPDLMPANKDYNMSFGQIKGLPVKTTITITKENVTMVANYELLELNTDLVPVNTFDPASAGYRVLSFEEMMRNKY